MRVHEVRKAPRIPEIKRAYEQSKVPKERARLTTSPHTPIVFVVIGYVKGLNEAV